MSLVPKHAGIQRLGRIALLTNTNQKKYLSVLGKFFRYLKREQLCSDCKKFVKVKSTAAD